MELVCNELSFFPLAENSHIAEHRFKIILQTFGGARRKFDFSHIRFLVNFSDQKVTTTQTFYEWIYTITNHTLRAAVIALFRPPFTDDLEAEETNQFFESEYTVSSEEAPERDSPIGIPVAFIKSIPTISFDSHNFWRNRKIQISKTNESEKENTTFIVYNICQPTDINSSEINEWAESSFPYFIETKELLSMYLNYQRFTSNFAHDFMQQFFDWKENDMKSFKHLLLLMKDVELHPFTGGRGRTENLKNRNKEASKRINITDRLSYSIENNIEI